MPKFKKNTGYQMPHGNSPHKFIGSIGLGRRESNSSSSAPKEINAQGSHYGIGVTGHRLPTNRPMVAGGLGMSPKFSNMFGAGLSGIAQRRAASAIGPGASKVDLLTGLPKRFSPRSVDRFATGRKRHRSVGNSLRGLFS